MGVGAARQIDEKAQTWSVKMAIINVINPPRNPNVSLLQISVKFRLILYKWMKLPTDKEIARLMRLLSDSSQVNVFIVQLNASALFVGKHQPRKMVKCTKMNPVRVLLGGVKQSTRYKIPHNSKPTSRPSSL